jgi:hypothetical protein
MDRSEMTSVRLGLGASAQKACGFKSRLPHQSIIRRSNPSQGQVSVPLLATMG